MDHDLELKFQRLTKALEPDFGPGMDLTALIFLIGVNEVGFGFKNYTKQEKVDLMHVAICSLLVGSGYYTFSHRDDNNWPHFLLVQNLPPLSDRDQQHLLKEAVIEYCLHHDYVKSEQVNV